MSQTARARFAITSWDEKPYSEGPDLPKLTRASVARTFSGDLQGEGRVEYLNGVATESYTVVPGSATGDLRGLTGEGQSAVGHGLEHPFELTYELRSAR